MLIEFSLRNFRSFREQQTLSMVASARLRKRENTVKPEVEGENFPALLKVAAIYGPNASGKSNLLEGLEAVRKMVARQPSASPHPLPVTPFRFDPELKEKASQFDIHFIHKKRRYSFYLAATPTQIVREKLVEYRKGRDQLLYSRELDIVETYDFGDTLEGSEQLHDTWMSLTNRQTLFLTQAVANSSDSLTQLRNPYEWLSSSCFLISRDPRYLLRMTQSLIANVPTFSDDVATLLRSVDVPVTSVTSRRRPSDRAKVSKVGDSLVEREDVTADEDPQFDTQLIHDSRLGSATFDLSEESDGTQSLISFAFPWYLITSKTPELSAQVLTVDELDSSLHPKIVESLISKFVNTNNHAQLIFTTHDTHLMNAKLLRRDQFWLTERDENGATQLRSIHDFEGRESEDIEKRYYEGRYRGLPLVRGI
jgi:AAA15 family ATPase/GTPase